MLIYNAISNDKKFIDKLIENKIKSNILIAYSKNLKTLKKIEKISNNILIDSGVFSILNNNKKNIDFDEYKNNYIKFIKKNDNNNINGFFELDLGALIPYTLVKQYREELFDSTDKIIPIWHSYLGIEEYKNLCNDYNYIGIGGIALKQIKLNKLPPLLKYAHNHGTKIHALGLTTINYLNKYPFDSVDSTTYSQARFGKTLLTKNGERRYIKCSEPNNYLSFISSIKLQQYYYRKWFNYSKKLWGE